MWHLTVLTPAPEKPWRSYETMWANVGFLMGQLIVVQTQYVVAKRNSNWYCVIGRSTRLPPPFFCYLENSHLIIMPRSIVPFHSGAWSLATSPICLSSHQKKLPCVTSLHTLLQVINKCSLNEWIQQVFQKNQGKGKICRLLEARVGFSKTAEMLYVG